MCLACQMEDELWFAYLDHVAQQEKKAAGQEAEAATPTTSETPTPDTKAPASPFVCDEQPSE